MILILVHAISISLNNNPVSLKKITIILCLLSSVAIGQDKIIDSLQNLLSTQRRDTTRLNVLLELTYEFLRKDIDKAKSYAYQSIALSGELNSHFKLCGAYSYMVNIYQNSHNGDSARFYLGKMDSLAKEYPSKIKIRTQHNSAAGLYYKNVGQYAKALPYLIDNLSRLTTENESRAGLFLNIGNTYFAMGEFRKAVENHLQALRLFEKVGSKRGQAFALNSVGNDFFQLDQYTEARTYFESSLEIKTVLQDKRGIISSMQGLADVYRQTRQYTLAETYYKRSIQLASELKVLNEELIARYALGVMYKQIGNLTDARINFSRSLDLTRQVGDSTTSAKIKSELLSLDFQKNQPQSTEKTLLHNLETVKGAGDRRSELNEYGRISDFYAVTQRYDKAYEYLKKYTKLYDSIEGNAVLLQMKQVEEQYQAEKNEREIALLKKDQQLKQLELAKQRSNLIMIIIGFLSLLTISVLLFNRYRINNRNRRLVEIERMRNTIARDLHDDIGSTLTSINIISQMAVQESSGDTTAFKRIAHHSASMMEGMSDIVWSINPHNDALEHLVTKMKEFATEILEPSGVSYEFSGEETLMNIPLDAMTRKNIFLIFKEALNNAAKYSGADVIRINIRNTGRSLILTIHDNGMGFDASDGSSGNGLVNMRTRAGAINANIQVKSSNSSGTEVRLVLPT
jgi:signal transduction histidine kinase